MRIELAADDVDNDDAAGIAAESEGSAPHSVRRRSIVADQPLRILLVYDESVYRWATLPSSPRSTFPAKLALIVL